MKMRKLFLLIGCMGACGLALGQKIRDQGLVGRPGGTKSVFAKKAVASPVISPPSNLSKKLSPKVFRRHNFRVVRPANWSKGKTDFIEKLSSNTIFVL
jgi:hypothetical protein